MFCTNCGKKSKPEDSFCWNCGNELGELKETSFLVREEKDATRIHIDHRGTAVRSGKEWERSGKRSDGKKLEGAKEFIRNLPLPESIKKENISQELIKESAKNALKIIGIGLLISLVLSLVLGSIYEEVMEAISYVFSSRFIVIFLLSLLSPIVVDSSRLSLSLQGGILFLLFIPVVSIFIVQREKFKDEEKTGDHLGDYLGTAVMFTFFVKILAMFSAGGIDAVIISVRFRLHSLGSLFTVLLLAFIIQVFLSMVIKKDNVFEIFETDYFPTFGQRVVRYTMQMGKIVAVITLIMLIALFRTEATATWILAIPYLFLNLWLWIIGGTFSLQDSVQGFNIFNQLFSVGDMASAGMWGVILVFSALFLMIFVVMYEAVKGIDQKEQYFYKLGMLAVGFSIINLIAAFLVNFTANVDGLKFTLGYGYLNVIIATTAWVFAIGGIIYLGGTNETVKKTTSFLNKSSGHLMKGGIAALIIGVLWAGQDMYMSVLYGFGNQFNYIIDLLIESIYNPRF